MSRGPEPTASTAKILATLRDHYAPVSGTSYIADEIGVARQTADRRLRVLEEDGLVETDKIGQSRIWWLTTAGKKRLAELEATD